MTTYLDCVTVEHNPKQKTINRAVIWLHGLGASGHDFEPVVPELGLSEDLAVRFIFPHAPQIPVTINGGFVMPAWYDILEMNIERKVDVAQIEQSASKIRDLIAREIERGVPAKNIVIAGFSQGGAVAYHVALSYEQKLAGLLALSTYFATAEYVKYTQANENLPIRIDHGTQDPVVPVVLGERAKAMLEEKGYQVQYHTFAMAHQVCLAQIKAIGLWLNQQLSRDVKFQ